MLQARVTIHRGLVVGLLALALAGCDSTSQPAPLPGPIITITNSWVDQADADHTFDFQSDDDGQTEGTFVGNEFQNFADVGGLTGNWKDGEIEFTVDRASGAEVTYQGTFTEESPDRLTFTHGQETLELVRDSG